MERHHLLMHVFHFNTNLLALRVRPERQSTYGMDFRTISCDDAVEADSAAAMFEIRRDSSLFIRRLAGVRKYGGRNIR